jgi:hypothetical protein
MALVPVESVLRIPYNTTTVQLSSLLSCTGRDGGTGRRQDLADLASSVNLDGKACSRWQADEKYGDGGISAEGRQDVYRRAWGARGG